MDWRPGVRTTRQHNEPEEVKSYPHFLTERLKHGSLIWERCFDYKIRIRIKLVNQLTALSGLPSLACSARFLEVRLGKFIVDQDTMLDEASTTQR